MTGCLLIAQLASSGPAWIRDLDPGVAVHGVKAMADGGAVLLLSVPAAAAGNDDLALLRIDALGAQIWAKTYETGVDRWAKAALASTRDDGFAVCATRGTETLLLRLGPGGDMLRASSLSLQLGWDIVETTNASLALSGDSQFALVDANGDAIWARLFALPGGATRGGRTAVEAGPDGEVAGAWAWSEPFQGSAVAAAFTSGGDLRWGLMVWQSWGDAVGATDIRRDPAGGYFIAGDLDLDAGGGVWVGHLDDQGALDPLSPRVMTAEFWNATMTLTAEGHPVVASGVTTMVLAGMTDLSPFREFFDAYPGITFQATGLETASDGGFFLTGNVTDAVGVTTGRLIRTAALGRVPPCGQSSPQGPSNGREMMATSVTAAPLSFTSTPIAVASSPATIRTHDVCTLCASQLTAVTGLRGVRRVDDATFTWTDVGGASGYDLWYVIHSANIDRARRGDFAAAPVPGCTWPSPTTSSACTDAGAIRRNPSLFFYQVRAVCGAGAEGP